MLCDLNFSAPLTSSKQRKTSRDKKHEKENFRLTALVKTLQTKNRVLQFHAVNTKRRLTDDHIAEVERALNEQRSEDAIAHAAVLSTMVSPEEYKDLSDSYNELADVVHEEHDDLRVAFNNLTKDYNVLNGEHNNLRVDFNVLTGEHDNLLEAFKELADDHNVLNGKHDDLLVAFNDQTNKMLSDNVRFNAQLEDKDFLKNSLIKAGSARVKHVKTEGARQTRTALTTLKISKRTVRRLRRALADAYEQHSEAVEDHHERRQADAVKIAVLQTTVQTRSDMLFQTGQFATPPLRYISYPTIRWHIAGANNLTARRLAFAATNQMGQNVVSVFQDFHYNIDQMNQSLATIMDDAEVRVSRNGVRKCVTLRRVIMASIKRKYNLVGEDECSTFITVRQSFELYRRYNNWTRASLGAVYLSQYGLCQELDILHQLGEPP